MASASASRGIPSLPSTLIRATSTPPEVVEPAEALDAADDQGEGQGRGSASAEARPKTVRRRKPTPPAGETKGHKLSLPESVYDRLQLLAIKRRTTVSAVAAEILDRNLPRLRIETDG